METEKLKNSQDPGKAINEDRYETPERVEESRSKSKDNMHDSREMVNYETPEKPCKAIREAIKRYELRKRCKKSGKKIGGIKA